MPDEKKKNTKPARVFVSISTRDLTDSTLKAMENEAIAIAKKEKNLDLVDVIEYDRWLGEETHLIDNATIRVPRLTRIPDRLELLSTADLAVFVNDWTASRRCSVEHACATLYKIDTLDVSVVI